MAITPNAREWITWALVPVKAETKEELLRNIQCQAAAQSLLPEPELPSRGTSQCTHRSFLFRPSSERASSIGRTPRAATMLSTTSAPNTPANFRKFWLAASARHGYRVVSLQAAAVPLVAGQRSPRVRTPASGCELEGFFVAVAQQSCLHQELGSFRWLGQRNTTQNWKTPRSRSIICSAVNTNMNRCPRARGAACSR